MSTLDHSSHHPQIRLVRSVGHGRAPQRGPDQRASDALLHQFYLFTAGRLGDVSLALSARVAAELGTIRRLADVLGIEVGTVPELSRPERALAWEHVARTATLCLLDDLVRQVHGGYGSVEVDGWAGRVLSGLDEPARAEIWEDTGLGEDDVSLAFAITAQSMIDFESFRTGVRLRYASGDLLLRANLEARTILGYHTTRTLLGVVTTTPSAQSWQPVSSEPVEHVRAAALEFLALDADVHLEETGGRRRSPGANPSTFRASGEVALTTSGSVRAIGTPHGFVLEGETSEDGLLAVLGGQELSVSIGVGEDGPEDSQAVRSLFAG